MPEYSTSTSTPSIETTTLELDACHSSHQKNKEYCFFKFTGPVMLAESFPTSSQFIWPCSKKAFPRKDSAIVNSIPLGWPTGYSIFCTLQFLSSPTPTVAMPFSLPISPLRAIMQQRLLNPTSFANPVISGLMGRRPTEELVSPWHGIKSATGSPWPIPAPAILLTCQNEAIVG